MIASLFLFFLSFSLLVCFFLFGLSLIVPISYTYINFCLFYVDVTYPFYIFLFVLNFLLFYDCDLFLFIYLFIYFTCLVFEWNVKSVTIFLFFNIDHVFVFFYFLYFSFDVFVISYIFIFMIKSKIFLCIINYYLYFMYYILW